MQVYKQTTDFTSSASSLLMILNHFNRLELTRENEFRIWQKSALLPIRACSIYGLALVAKEHDVNSKIVVGNLDYEYPNYRFKSYTKKELNNAKFTSKLYFNQAKIMKINIEERIFDVDEVKKLLNEKNILLLRINVGPLRNIKTTANYVVVHGYSDNKFLIFDSRIGKKLVQEDQFRECFETVKTKGKRDHRMIIFENTKSI